MEDSIYIAHGEEYNDASAGTIVYSFMFASSV